MMFRTPMKVCLIVCGLLIGSSLMAIPSSAEITSQADWQAAIAQYGMNTTSSPGDMQIMKFDEFDDGVLNEFWTVDLSGASASVVEFNGKITMSTSNNAHAAIIYGDLPATYDFKFAWKAQR